MPEHRIRLRGPWDRIPSGDPEGPTVVQVALPCPSPERLSGRFRLVRRFGRVPFDPATQTLRLDLIGVPGLVGVDLNGSDRPLEPGTGAAWSAPIDGPLPARNVLTLDVDRSGLGPFEDPWGSISLAIGPIRGHSSIAPSAIAPPPRPSPARGEGARLPLPPPWRGRAGVGGSAPPGDG